MQFNYCPSLALVCLLAGLHKVVHNAGIVYTTFVKWWQVSVIILVCYSLLWSFDRCTTSEHVTILGHFSEQIFTRVTDKLYTLYVVCCRPSDLISLFRLRWVSDSWLLHYDSLYQSVTDTSPRRSFHNYTLILHWNHIIDIKIK